MIERIIAFALHQRFITVALALILTIGGIASYLRLPIEAYPNIGDVKADCWALLDVAVPDFTGTERNGCILTGTNTISNVALLACWLVMVVVALLILALGAMPIALLSLAPWGVINRGLVAMIAILMAVYTVITVTLGCPACRRAS